MTFLSKEKIHNDDKERLVSVFNYTIKNFNYWLTLHQRFERMLLNLGSMLGFHVSSFALEVM